MPSFLPETITCSSWNLGCPSNRGEPRGKFLHNTENPAFTDNEYENQGNKNPTRMKEMILFNSKAESLWS